MSKHNKRRNRERKTKRKQLKQWFRSGKFNRHHIKNKCRGGQATLDNMLVMDVERHNAFHFLFKNMSFEQVIELLKRTVSLKNKQQQENKLKSYAYI